MRRALLVALVAAAGTAVATGEWAWPVENVVVARTFGQYVDGEPLRAMDLGGTDHEVFAVADGTVVAVFGPAGRPTDPLGYSVAIVHDSGLRSMYAHLARLPRVRLGERVSIRTPIGHYSGVAGRTGLSDLDALRFSVYDPAIESYINPLTLLPPLADTIRPAVRAVYAVSDGRTFDLLASNELPPGAYDLLVDAVDRVGGARAPLVGVYSLSAAIPGSDSRRIRFDALRHGDPPLLLPDRAPLPVHGRDGLLRVARLQVSDAPITVAITARDYSGNTTVRTVRIEPRARE